MAQEMSTIPDSEGASSSPPGRPTQVKPLRTDDPRSETMKRFFRTHNYELVGELGRGGMGVVYLAQDTKLGRRVALKTLAPDRQRKQNSLMRFEREARTFAAIRHPHIANLYEFSDEGDYQFLALEYIEGTDLETERRRRRRWTSMEVAKIVRSLADALEHTHSKGILHRDIKPGNILIEYNTGRVVLTDFGLAKGNNDITLTASGYAVGTPAYMAPEQISDQFNARPDGRADLFALGTVAYEMLTGRHPFIGADDMATMRAIVQKPPVSLREIDSTVPAELEKIILQILEKSPEKRQASGKVIVGQLDDFIESGSERRRSTPAVASERPPDMSTAKTEPINLAAPRTAAPAAASVAPQAAPPAASDSPFKGLKTTHIIAIGIACMVVGMLLMGVIFLLLKR